MVKDAMREIESHEFAARLNVASDLATFFRIAEEESAVRALFRQLDSSVEQERLFLHSSELSTSSTDVRYENQWDTALAIYLWLVSLKNPNLAVVMAVVVSKAPQCWWAAKISYSQLQQLTFQNAAGFIGLESAIYRSLVPDQMRSVNSGEAIFPIVTLSDAWVSIWHSDKADVHSKGEFTDDMWTYEPGMPRVYAETGAGSE